MSAVLVDLRFSDKLGGVFRLLFGITRLTVWTGRAKDLEIMVLRHQLVVSDRFNGCKMLVRDGADQFATAFDEIFRTEGITVAKTPPRTPVANCFIERWCGTLRRELLDRTISWNEPRLRRLIDEYLAHYNEHRPHRSLEQQPPITATVRSGVAPQDSGSRQLFACASRDRRRAQLQSPDCHNHRGG